MFNKFLFFLSLLFLGISMFAQDTILTCLHIEEIVVDANRQKYYSEGTKQIVVDSITMASNSSANLGELLSKQTALNIKSYGSPGAQANLSLRNAGSERTQVNWNGIPINSITLGSADLSLIPASGFNSIDIHCNASSALYGSGTFGGAVNLDNKPTWKNQFSVTTHHLLASFNTYYNALQATISNKKLYYNIAVFGTSSDADYPYKDDIQGVDTTRSNADYYGYGTIQSLHYKINKRNIVEGGIWYQVMNKNLPQIKGSLKQIDENQRDSSLKAFAKWTKRWEKISIQTKYAHIRAFQTYVGESLASSEKLDTTITNAFSHYADVNFRHFLNDLFRYDVALTYNNEHVDASAYPELKNEQSLGLITAGKFTYRKFISFLSARKEWNTVASPKPLFGIGLQYMFLNNSTTVRGSLNQKYRLPSFNDKYWANWGNPNLVPESGYTMELGINNKLTTKYGGITNIDITGYFTKLNDMIMWVSEDSVWHPYNYLEANISGLELLYNQNKNLTEQISISHTFQSNISYSEITNVDSAQLRYKGKQLRYIPKYQISYNLYLTLFKSFHFGVNYSYMSERFYDDTERILEPLHLIDVFVSQKVRCKNFSFIFEAKAKNIANVQYEMVKSYPMPKRSYQLGIKFHFLKTSFNNKNNNPDEKIN